MAAKDWTWMILEWSFLIPLMVGLFSWLELGSSRLVDAIVPKSAPVAGSKTSSKHPNSLSVRHGETSCALTVRSMSIAVSFLTKLCAQHNLKSIKKTPFCNFSSWISCEMISPSIMVVAKLLANTEAALLDLLGMFWTNTRQDFGWQVLTQCQVNNLLRNQVISPIFSLFLDVTTFRITCSCPPFFLPAKALWWPLTPPAIESQLDANSPRICRKSVWRIFSQRNAQQEGTALKLYSGQMVRQWGRQIG